ncbi:Type III restriction enzyme, res subunit [uncultured Prevotella sp.]|uniref:DEAD/DEAH box helicase family protein n=1 Tax=uncultured Prevotella sp. TaxID=159272 RepID=UPI001A51285A|nr:DEAD/DEAH box helicase family protein [uncultured Prevotella sp.]VTY11744.1 Type III restriction enzyme, res subunit [uncultured Prevotella sp.]
MFYKILQKKRNEWLRRSDCPIETLLSYIECRGMMRDAQIDAIKTYLFLKIECKNKPLWRLFTEGNFLTIDLDTVSLTVKARTILEKNKAAATLYEYACLHDDKGKTIAPALRRYIEDFPDKIDYVEVFKKIFYDVDYPDYIFSLPMGAGKTYLMAAFIYLDLYFSLNEPDNPAFAHNFIILAPSGLKSSIIPSIKNIQDFDPTWILPDPAASQIKNEIQFEILDAQKTAQKSNLVKNPNAQKINSHLTSDYVRGLVAVTNAEKVILDKYDKNNELSFLSKKELKELDISNELRSIVGKIPHLSVFIDEVHHASDSDIKLRQVVSRWTKCKTFNCVLGFSGTPYLSSADSVSISSDLSLQNKNLANVVYYYPLIEGVGNFLKRPTIKISNGEYDAIVRKGITDFLDTYGNLIYANGTCAKLAIYCGRIDALEENIYPIAAELVSKYGLIPTDTILKYHGGNKQYSVSEGVATEFASLDTRISKIKIILLAQIGKEGWDCKSLTSIILPQKGACPQNMVLQTSCRCLRQVEKKAKETALIWLNEDNAKTLNKELDKQQHTSIEELNRGGSTKLHTLQRFSRMKKLRVPPIDFFQLKVSYLTLVLEEELNTPKELQRDDILSTSDLQLISQQNLKGEIESKTVEQLQDDEHDIPITFNSWLYLICKESFGTLFMAQLKKYATALQTIFDTITETRNGIYFLKGEYNQMAVRSNVRKAFIPHRSIDVKEEVIPETAKLLQMKNFKSIINVNDTSKYTPEEHDVLEIIEADKVEKPLKAEIQAIIDKLKTLGYQEQPIRVLLENPDNYESTESNINNKTYHYLPYRFDSSFEKDYFSDSLQTIIRNKQLEFYFNGDKNLTEFKIRCYKKHGKYWSPLGNYTPDFLVISRDEQDAIKQILIIETKGEGFAAKFAERRQFMEEEFVKLNNERFGYNRFSFLYIEDTMTPTEQDEKTINAINQFFK